VARTAGIVLDLFARTERHRYGPHRQHRADLYVPRDGDAPHPLVVLVHGGYWRAFYGKVVMKPVTVGRDFGTEIEVVDGLTAQDQVIVSPPDSITDATRVRIATDAKPAAKAES